MLKALTVAKEKQDVEILDVFSPVPVEEVTELLLPSRSPVRFVTFVFAVMGMVGGFALAILTSIIWDLIVGGKPVTHHVPFVVVGFELTILSGAIGTFLALLFFSRLPNRKFPGGGYRPEFSLDRFGVWLTGDLEQARKLLKDAGADDVYESEVGR